MSVSAHHVPCVVSPWAPSIHIVPCQLQWWQRHSTACHTLSRCPVILFLLSLTCFFENHLKRVSFPGWKAMTSQENKWLHSNHILFTNVPRDLECSCAVNMSSQYQWWNGVKERQRVCCCDYLSHFSSFLTKCLTQLPWDIHRSLYPRIPWDNPLNR